MSDSERASTLPAGFEALEPFVEQWAVAGADDRMRRRIDSSAEEREAFFGACAPLLDEALARLDGCPLSRLEDADRRLLDLVLSFAHVALAVEQQRELEPHHAAMHAHFLLERSTEDFGTPTPSATR